MSFIVYSFIIALLYNTVVEECHLYIIYNTIVPTHTYITILNSHLFFTHTYIIPNSHLFYMHFTHLILDITALKGLETETTASSSSCI